MKSAVGYLRVSTDEQTVENQQIVLQKYASEHGFHITKFFEDSAVSGTTAALERKGFKSMIEHIKGINTTPSLSVESVLVYELSRIGRSFWDVLETIKTVEELGSPIISVSPKEAFLQTLDPSLRKLLISILSWVAERERETLVQRTKDGINRARSNGKVLGRPKRNINITELTSLLKANGINATAKELRMSKHTIYKHINSTLA